MSQTPALVATLKRTLKLHGLTYGDVAEGLGLSEASVKRTFAEQSFSLSRLEEICQMMGWGISDLVKAMEAERSQLNELTEPQEEELVSDTRLLLVAFLIVSGWSVVEIQSFYEFDEHQMVQYLARLDRLKLIDLLPNNRIKLLISTNFAWRKNGPIQRFFAQHMQAEFFKSHFDGTDESFLMLSGMLSHEASMRLMKKMDQLANLFNELIEEDKHRPLEERFGGGMILALRPWRPEAFEQYRREEYRLEPQG